MGIQYGMIRAFAAAFILSAPHDAFAGGLEAAKSKAGAVFDGNLSGISLAIPVVAASPAPALAQGEQLRLSEFAQKLSQDPAVLDAQLKEIGRRMGDRGSWTLSPENKERLLRALERADKTFLDSFPTLSLQATTRGIRAYAKKKGPLPDDMPAKGTVPLLLTGKPKLPAEDAFYDDLGDGVYYGDIIERNTLPYGDNQAVAAVLNRLSLNTPGKPADFKVSLGATSFDSVEDFLNYLIAGGHFVEVRDKRMFANFGDLWLKEKGVMRPVTTPFYVKTGITLPSGKPLAVPVVHSEFNLVILGSRVNADLSFYFGLGGEAAFWPLATENQKWVGGRVLRTWDGAAAVALMERCATARREIREKGRKHKLPMGGYGTLGACSDVHAMILGQPVFPQIRDLQYYQDGMTIDAWSQAVYPHASVTPRKILDELPVDDPADILLPELRKDIQELKAWVGGRS